MRKAFKNEPYKFYVIGGILIVFSGVIFAIVFNKNFTINPEMLLFCAITIPILGTVLGLKWRYEKVSWAKDVEDAKIPSKVLILKTGIPTYIVLGVLTIVATVIGLLMVFDSNASVKDRLAGAASILFFGVGGGVVCFNAINVFSASKKMTKLEPDKKIQKI